MFLYRTGIQSKLQYMGLCFSVGFDIEKAAQCFDSFQAVMERKMGEEKAVGGGGCGREGILGCSVSR